jgi:hypothetical protein
MATATRATLFQVFSPAKEVELPEKFAGRAKQVLRLTDALHVGGSCPVIYGHKGLGKSSLALQVERIAKGDVELLDDLGQIDRALAEEARFIVLPVTCTDAVRDLDGLLRLLINAADGVVAEAESAGKFKLVEKQTKRGISLKPFTYETTRKYEDAKGQSLSADLSLAERLDKICCLLSDMYEQPVLFVIDEVDRVEQTKGLASFLKAYSSDRLKFILVGIGNNISDLLADHASLERSLAAVEVKLMEAPELEEIVVRAETALAALGHGLAFAPDAKRLLSRIAAGFPWFVHVLGQQALVNTFDAGQSVVPADAVDRAAADMIANDFTQQFSDRYQRAVRDSPSREIVLRAFAEWRQADVPTREIYQVARSLGVSNPSAYKGHLCKREYGPVLFEPDLQGQGLVRFHDEMFKAYIRIRPSLYADNDARVREKFGR